MGSPLLCAAHVHMCPLSGRCGHLSGKENGADEKGLSQKIRRSGFLFGSAGRETRHSAAKLLSGLAFSPLTADFMPTRPATVGKISLYKQLMQQTQHVRSAQCEIAASVFMDNAE
jgi:hypothetical protein